MPITPQTLRTSLGRLLFVFSLLVAGGCEQPGRQPEQWIRQAELDYAAGKHTSAITQLSRVLRESDGPQLKNRALYTRALAHAKEGQRQLAYADLKDAVRAADVRDVTWRAFVMLGTLYFEDERWESAQVAYAAAAERMPAAPPKDEVLFRLGQSYERLGRWSQARAPYQQIVSDFGRSRFRDDAQRRLAINASHFAIQCGAFATASSADTLARQLQGRGLAAYTRREPRGGRTLNVVLVGRYGTYDEVWRALPGVRQYIPSAIIWP
jgi:tetratricopeptide (TPR) repeat protein